MIFGWGTVIVVSLAVLVVASRIDIRERRIPDWLTLPLIFFGLAYHGLVLHTIGASLAFALVGVAIGLVPNLLGWNWWGGGDVKLMAGVGAIFGRASLTIFMMSFIVAGIWITIKNKREGKSLRKKVYLPFAPFVLCGVAIYLLWVVL